MTDRELAEKLKRDNATLTEAIKRLRAEAEEVARREGEAAEQVKSSVQVAEALRMEKAELEYEVKEKLKLRYFCTSVVPLYEFLLPPRLPR